MGDFCVQGPPGNSRFHDRQSDRYMQLHNLAALCEGVAYANRVFDLQAEDRSSQVNKPAQAACEAITQIFSSGTRGSLDKFRSTFKALRHGDDGDVSDQRDYADE